MNIITIDCGASFLKGALFEDEHLVKKTQRQAPKVNTNDWHVPTQINYLMDAVRSMFRELTRGYNEVVLCISNEMHGFILTDEDDNPYTDYISWQMEFGNVPLAGKNGMTSLQMLSAEKYRDEIMKSGMPLRAGLPNVNLLYLQHNLPWDKKKGVLRFFTLGDYILYGLSGKISYCHPTNAAATGLMDLETGTWNKKMVSLTAGTKIQFPEVGTGGITFVFEGVNVYALPAVGDQQAALLGAGLKEKNEISFNLGTGAQVSCLVDGLDYSGEYQIRPFFAGKYIKTIPHLPSGRALNVYFRFVRETATRFCPDVDDVTIWEWILDNVKQSNISDMECDLSFFANPITNRTRGSINNIGEYDFNIGNLFGTLFRQMADNFMMAARRIMPEESTVTKIVFSGGIARKISFIRERILKNYHTGIEFSVGKDETLYGLAKYAVEYK
ncbi:sedoheptulokinase [Anaerovibrio sp. RM50]|uniref:sedoheptulokinase n=1 Tax=Anaerovibrio sp. RM50 TaxID=1200557 RepID=UPI0004820470|nr:FGGY family carbohydrate kinase [Anaerovibrio sp. RM50]